MPFQHFKIVGHRGACGYAPENTMESFELAIAMGARWVELDVHFSKDGVPMVIHDATLNRTTSLRGPVASRTSAELSGPIGNGGHPVPTLPQVLRLLDGKSVGVYVELKSCPKEGLPVILEMLHEGGAPKILSSFNHRWLQVARSLSGKVKIQALFSRPPLRKPAWLDALNPVELGVAFSSSSAASATRMKKWGYPIIAYTVNRQEDMRRASGMGLDGVFCDFPDRAP